jgi:hypothetical protein
MMGRKLIFDMQNPADLQSALSKMQLEANVRLVGFDGNIARWQGELLRIGESIDPTRDMMDLVVTVNNPYEGIIPGKRPPLLKGMYASVEFLAPAQEMLIIPRKAMHQGRVYVAKENNQLEIRSVNVLHKQGELVIIESGIEEGERIIITDVIPVIEGLPLKTVLASEYQKQMAEDALGVRGETQ